MYKAEIMRWVIRNQYIVALICAACISLPLVAQKEDKVDLIRIVAVKPTPEPDTIITTIQLPRQGAVTRGNPVWMQVRMDGYALGANSPFDRAYEVANSDLGQTLHVVVDNHPYFPINGPSIQPFNEEGFYYNQSYKFEIPFNLAEGFHTVRIFPARSFGESLKSEKTFQSTWFWIEKEGDISQADVLLHPYLTCNEPGDGAALTESLPVLLDFYVTNCELSSDGYKVRLTIDGKTQRTLVSWKPYYIYGLKKGKHTLRLELVDEKNKTLPGSFNDVQKTITIESGKRS
jgi:hypothetical protein